jgi:hypothetical protein
MGKNYSASFEEYATKSPGTKKRSFGSTPSQYFRPSISMFIWLAFAIGDATYALAYWKLKGLIHRPNRDIILPDMDGMVFFHPSPLDMNKGKDK